MVMVVAVAAEDVLEHHEGDITELVIERIETCVVLAHVSAQNML